MEQVKKREKGEREMKLDRFKFLVILFGLLWMGIGQNARAGAVSPENMAERKQQRLAAFQERIVETDEYDAWLSRPQQDGRKSDNACVTNYASIVGKQPDVAHAPRLSDEDTKNLQRELTLEQVKYIQRGSQPMLTREINQSLKREGVTDIHDLSYKSVFMIFTTYLVA